MSHGVRDTCCNTYCAIYRKIGAFPSDQSLLKLAVSIMMDINEEWITGRRYINMEEI